MIIKTGRGNYHLLQFVLAAEEWARRCDRIPSGERGPFHGVPFSIKGNFQIKGCPANVGLTQFLERRCTEDAAAVSLIKGMGGVPFCLTNTPTLCLSMQCSNQIYGATGLSYSIDVIPHSPQRYLCLGNPCDPIKECGGSSGGEAALIGAGGSVVGIGNDLGGSLRFPAALCGIASLKPTFGRHLSSKGLFSPLMPNPQLHFISGIQ